MEDDVVFRIFWQAVAERLVDMDGAEMKHFLGKLNALLLILMICLGRTAVTATILVFAENSGSAPVYLPVVMGGSGSTGGGTLDNGGTVAGPDGVSVGAFTDTLTLSGPVVVTISKTSAPTPTFPAQTQVVGEFYQVSAGAAVYVAPVEPFILAFPAPSGVSTTNLALAVLSSGEGVADADKDILAWTLLEGKYDLAQNLFLTTIAGLTQEGNTFVLVTHPDFDSTANSAVSAVFRPNAPSRTQFDLFNVKCVYFSNANDCTAATEDAVAGYLTDIYDHIHGDLGFNKPRLRNLIETLAFDPHMLSSLGYTAYIEPSDYGYCASENAGGYYDRKTGRLVLCLNPAVGLSADYVHILIHEYFHATQYAYPPVLVDYEGGKDEAWIIEGMATTVEESYFVDEMLRSEVGGWIELHKVDVTLTSEVGLDEYFAQDFWVHYGQNMGSNGSNMSYLQDILMAGAKTENVVNVLGDGSHLKAYWEWVKNQVMEKDVDFGGVLQNPCNVEGQVVEEDEIFEHHYEDNPRHFTTVGPLTTAVVRLTFSHSYDFGVGWVSTDPLNPNPDALAALEYKFYKDGEAGCQARDDSVMYEFTGGIDAGEVYYVVISNTDYDGTYEYVISFELTPIPPQ